MAKPKRFRGNYREGDYILDNYQVTKVITSGRGMSDVYQVTDLTMNKDWIVKQIHRPSSFVNLTLKERRVRELEYNSLMHESNLMSKLQHPSIPRITKRVEDDNNVFLVMDYIPGDDLNSLLNTNKLTEETAVAICLKLARVLSYLHNLQNKIVYRDIKPANVILHGEQVFLIDFGIAEVITPNHKYPANALGTPGYVPPEQEDINQPLTPQSDIYAFGVLLYQLVTGVSPIAKHRFVDSDGVTREEFVQPQGGKFDLLKVDKSLSSGIAHVIAKCTEPDLSKRYSDMYAVMADLKNYHEFDNSVRKEYRRKVRTVRTVTSVGIATILLSAVPFFLNYQESSNEFSTAVAVARSSGLLQDYINASSLKPSDMSLYFGMLDSIKSDGVFTPEEEREFLSAVNPHISTIQGSDEYAEFAYQVGSTYWFYYVGADETTPYTLSVEWLRDAVELDYNPTEGISPKSMLAVGEFYKTVSSRIRSDSDVGMYAGFWDSLSSIDMSSEPDIVRTRVYMVYSDLINTYSYKLSQDGVSKAQVQDVVVEISDYVSSTTPSESNRENFEKLRLSSSTLQSSLEEGFES